MNARKYTTNPEILLTQGRAIMSSTDEARFHFKVFAVNMVLSGCPVSQISSLAGVSKVTVTSWVKTADEQGVDALRPRRRSGRPPKLSAEQRAAIDSAIQSSPEDFNFQVWDDSGLSSYINSAFGVQFSVRQCQRLFHDLGYSFIRPQPYPSKGYENSDEREVFKKRIEIENNDSLILVYQDEVHFQIQTIVTSAWYKKGSAPTVKSFPGRSGLPAAALLFRKRVSCLWPERRSSTMRTRFHPSAAFESPSCS